MRHHNLRGHVLFLLQKMLFYILQGLSCWQHQVLHKPHIIPLTCIMQPASFESVINGIINCLTKRDRLQALLVMLKMGSMPLDSKKDHVNCQQCRAQATKTSKLDLIQLNPPKSTPCFGTPLWTRQMHLFGTFRDFHMVILYSHALCSNWL